MVDMVTSSLRIHANRNILLLCYSLDSTRNRVACCDLIIVRGACGIQAIHQILFRQRSSGRQFAKFSPGQSFLLYSSYYSRQNHFSTALYYCQRCSPSAAEAISNSLFSERVGKAKAGPDVEGQGDQTVYKSLGYPIVLLTKKDGGVRFCVDYRKLNKVARFDAYPMPRIEELIDTVGPVTVISTLDLAKGYWQIPLDEGSRDKTAFTTPFGLYEFEVMPFGLHSAPATFQRMINHILQDCWSFARAYIDDDIVVFSSSWDEHLTHLHKVMNCLHVANLTINMSKCQFWRAKVHYLGRVIGGGQVTPDPQKLDAVRNYPTPVSKRQVRAFLGLAGYYRCFVSHFLTIAEPFTELTKTKNPDKVKWTKNCEVAFCKLKDFLVTPPVIKGVEPDKPYILQTDASELGLRAVLGQLKASEEHPTCK